jgi:hypothetical protein
MNSQILPARVVSIVSNVFNPDKLNTKTKLLQAGSIMALILTLGLLLALFGGGERVSSQTGPICVDGLGPVLPDVFKVCPVSGDPPTSPFSIRERWRTGNITISYQTPVLGDLYGNGQPVAVVGANNSFNAGTVSTTIDRNAKDLRVIDGATGALLRTITTPSYNWSGHAAVAIADVTGNGQGEIILRVHSHASAPAAYRGRLVAYDNLGNELWLSNQRYDPGTHATGYSGGSLAVADFNGDAIPEVFIGNQVFNARTGVRLVAGASSGSAGCPASVTFGCHINQVVAVDMDGDGVLELVAGNVAYKVNITNPNGEAGNTLTVWQQAAAVAGVGDGFTAIADIDLDSDPDVVVVRTSTGATTGNTVLYVWDGQTNQVMGILSAGIGTNGGPPLIGDIDGDGAPEIVLQNTNRLRAFDFVSGTGIVNKWDIATADGSGQTSLSMFDFNNDGSKELVYRDEDLLRIIDGSGSTATNLATFPCGSGTHTDMPVIGDIDGSGEARILVGCQNPSADVSQLRAYETNSFPWANTRPVWNQQAYFVTHINEDLTVPAPQFPHWTGFADPAQRCSDGTNRPLNAFQQQITDLDPDTGCPVLCPPVEYGDAPDSYGTLSITNGARHGIPNFDEVTGTSPLMLGSIVSHEPDGQPGQTANGDDDDGVTAFGSYVPAGGQVCTGTLGTYTTQPLEYCAVISVTNTGATAGQVVGWLDANGDGDFLDANDRSVPLNDPAVDDGIFTTGNIPAGVTRNVIVVWTGLSALPSSRYFRFRVTRDTTFFSDPQPLGAAIDGEVEDYVSLAPSAAAVSISGRVLTADGRGIRSTAVVLTDSLGNSRTAITSSFGYYRFDEVPAGETYVLSVSSKRYQFAPRVVTVQDEIVNLDFIAQE